MNLPHDSFLGTIAAGIFLTCLLLVVAQWLTTGS